MQAHFIGSHGPMPQRTACNGGGRMRPSRGQKIDTFPFLAGRCYNCNTWSFPIKFLLEQAGLPSSMATGLLTFAGGRWTEVPPLYSCAPNSPRVMSQRADLAASSSSKPGGQLSVSTSDRNTDVLGPTASCMGKGRIWHPQRDIVLQRALPSSAS